MRDLEPGKVSIMNGSVAHACYSLPFLDVSGSRTRRAPSGPVQTLTWSFSTAQVKSSVRG